MLCGGILRFWTGGHRESDCTVPKDFSSSHKDVKSNTEEKNKWLLRTLIITKLI